MAKVIRGSGSVVPGEVVDAREEAEAIVAAARAEAMEIVATAEAQALALREEAARSGRDEARSEAAALLVAAARRRDGALADAESEIVQLGLAAAKHIVGDELSASPERIRDIARDVLDRARRAREVRLRAHPEDATELEDSLPGVDVVPDAEIARGGCVVTTELGRLDARLEVRLDALRRHLRLLE